jgi:hypothetical protein
MLYVFEEEGHELNGKLVPGAANIWTTQSRWRGQPGPGHPTEVAVTDDKTGSSDTFGLPTMSVVSFVGTSQSWTWTAIAHREACNQMPAVWGLLVKGGD